MSHHLKITAATVLSSALLLSGCASTGMLPSTSNNQVNQNYQLPQEINEGYWAASSLIDGQAVVVNFRSGVANNYSFRCNANGSYSQIGVESYNMVPSSTGIGLQNGSNPVFSEINVTSFVPKNLMSLNQKPTDPEIRKAMPNGLNYNYRYTPTLTPICP